MHASAVEASLLLRPSQWQATGEPPDSHAGRSAACSDGFDNAGREKRKRRKKAHMAISEIFASGDGGEVD